MGDDNEISWEMENKFYESSANNPEDDFIETVDEIDDINENDNRKTETIRTELKKEKRKLRIAQLKIKKRNRIDENEIAIAATKAESDQLDQFHVFSNAVGMHPLGNLLTPSLFSHLHHKSDPKINCNFIKAISVFIPFYKQTFTMWHKRKDLDTTGTPNVVIICAGAVRAAEVINSISKHLQCKIGKLFAKHFKLQDQLELLSKSKFPVVVGTPNRLMKLAEYGGLRMSVVDLVLIDMKTDMKKFSVLTLRKVQDDLFDFVEKFVLSGPNSERTLRNPLKIVLVPDEDSNEPITIQSNVDCTSKEISDD